MPNKPEKFFVSVAESFYEPHIKMLFVKLFCQHNYFHGRIGLKCSLFPFVQQLHSHKGCGIYFVYSASHQNIVCEVVLPTLSFSCK